MPAALDVLRHALTGTPDVPAPPSRRELAALLTAPNWTEVLHVLAASEPEALRQLAEALPALHR
ncbi:hypothetical protein AB0A63_02810 [Lentzea sp. NPDC042327]|uniref:hypothetical protein n=1 Tax=Lentzea sp. NPDC042327 TaxID=3154801 RepID=UPI0033C236F0